MNYFDNASTTPVDEKIQNLIFETMKKFGNPSNNYLIGKEAKRMIEKAREQVASAIGAEPNEIYFTSGASESNSMAILQREHCWCSPYEHHSIIYNKRVEIKTNLEESLLLLKKDYENKKIANDYSNNLMVSQMLVNNETGEIFNIKSIAELCDKMGILLHSDATQSIGKIRVNVKEEKIKILSLSGHKFYVPKGIGAIFIDKNINPIIPLIYGGGQERKVRGGTENVPYIVALGEGITQAVADIDKNYYHYLNLKNIFLKKLKTYKNIDWINNSPDNSSIPSILNISFKNIEGEILASLLNDEKIYVGTGSACSTGNFEPSHVLKAMKVPDDYISGAIRISFGKENTEEEVIQLAEKIFEKYKLLI